LLSHLFLIASWFSGNVKAKFKIRNSNTQTNPNPNNPKSETKPALGVDASCFAHYAIFDFFEFVSDFDIRISQLFREFPSHHSLVTDH